VTSLSGFRRALNSAELTNDKHDDLDKGGMDDVNVRFGPLTHVAHLNVQKIHSRGLSKGDLIRKWMMSIFSPLHCSSSRTPGSEVVVFSRSHQALDDGGTRGYAFSHTWISTPFAHSDLQAAVEAIAEKKNQREKFGTS
jgi:hypothetical protein